MMNKEQFKNNIIKQFGQKNHIIHGIVPIKWSYGSFNKESQFICTEYDVSFEISWDKIEDIFNVRFVDKIELGADVIDLSSDEVFYTGDGKTFLLDKRLYLEDVKIENNVLYISYHKVFIKHEDFVFSYAIPKDDGRDVNIEAVSLDLITGESNIKDMSQLKTYTANLKDLILYHRTHIIPYSITRNDIDELIKLNRDKKTNTKYVKSLSKEFMKDVSQHPREPIAKMLLPLIKKKIEKL